MSKAIVVEEGVLAGKIGSEGTLFWFYSFRRSS